MTAILVMTMSFGFSSIAGAWEYGADSYTYFDNGQLDGTCPDNICTGKAATITNDSDDVQELNIALHYGIWIGNYQWGEEHVGRVIWHEIPMSTNNWTQQVPVGKVIYFRAVLREQHPTTGQWLIYHILSTPAVSKIFEKDGGGIYYMFPPEARYYNSSFEKDIFGYVLTVENSIENQEAL